MSVQSDKWIIKMAKEQAMISPFEDKQIREGKISLVFLHTGTMREYQMSSKYLLMLTLKL